MTIRKFLGILGFLLSVIIAGSSAYFLDGVFKVDSVFYSRMFVLLIASFVAGWLIGEGFERRGSFLFALSAMLLGILGAISHELFFVVRKATDTESFRFLINSAINGMIVSSFVLFGRNSSSLRLPSSTSEEVESPGSSDALVLNQRVEEVTVQEVASEPEEPIVAPIERNELVLEKYPDEGSKEISHEDSEKDPILGATFFEKNADLIIEKAKLEAEKIIFNAGQEVLKKQQEKEKLENEIKMLVYTEKNLLEQYKKQS